MWEVTGHPQPLFLPIFDHNIATVHVKLLGHFARNQPMMRTKRPSPIDRRRLINGPYLLHEVVAVIGDQLRAVFLSGSSVNDVETPFITILLQTAGRVVPLRERRLLRRAWMGNDQAKAEINMAMTTRRATWKQYKTDTQDRQLKRAVRRENTRVHKVCDAAYERFL